MTTEREPIDIAYDAIPEYRAIQAADDALRQRVTALRNGGGAPPVDLVADVVDAVTAGKPVPGDLGRRAWEAQQTTEFVKAELLILQGAEKRLKNQREMAVRAGADNGLRALRPLLDELIDTARPMAAALRGVHDAQTAIDRGPDAVTAWSNFNQLVDRYARIRGAQYKLTRDAAGENIAIDGKYLDFGSVFSLWSEIANVTQLWPEWTPRRGGAPVRPPWPVANPAKPFRVRHDREWFMWVLNTPQVQLWVPTLGELRKAYADQLADAVARGGEPAEKTGEPLKRPVHYRGGDGSEWTEFQPVTPADTAAAK
ncbi:hypothetical protein LIX60_17470 [Streptomyces sp. S07_1.15]|uniref:hypothetical protein n=1 Tax=Streptomyces sp. S07_1.15 TaxID=2873925 RepID=UPI001D13C75E|nr:hypothetical protein [Streptomyces sp. S07_1.15]MCC3653219.1 hypothetical protein [Streptomyces sp. S07_1.15]